VGRKLPTNAGTHSSTGKARGFLLPGCEKNKILLRVKRYFFLTFTVMFD